MRVATVTGSARLPCEIQGTVRDGSGTLHSLRTEKKRKQTLFSLGGKSSTYCIPAKGVYGTTVERPLVNGWEIVTSEREAL